MVLLTASLTTQSILPVLRCRVDPLLGRESQPVSEGDSLNGSSYLAKLDATRGTPSHQ